MLGQFCLNRSRIPDLHDEAHLLTTLADLDLKFQLELKVSEQGVWNTYIILIDVISWSIKNFVLVDADVDSLALGVVTRTNGKSR